MNTSWTWNSSVLVVTGLVAAVLAFDRPAFLSTKTPPRRIQEDELETIATLRAIAAAEQRFQASAAIDTNCDGVGEYGYLAELAGSKPLRVACDCAPCAGTREDVLGAPLLPADFRIVRREFARHAGYFYQMWLPSEPSGANQVSGIEEDVTGGKLSPPFPAPHTGARLWCCYAWPVEYDVSGHKAFFVNEQGVVLQFLNDTAAPFAGTWMPPPFYDAYTVEGDMASPVRIGVAGPDGSIWRRLP